MNFYDKNGNVISIREFEKLSRNMDYKVIKQETLPDGKWISTVWLGMDHGLGDGFEIFESMIFPSEGVWDDIYCRRYATEEEAIEGHKELVEMYSKTEGEYLK